MQFNTETTSGGGEIEIDIDHLTIAGWTGRDAAAVQHHIDELAEIGVAPPSQVPLFYRVSNDLLTTRGQIEVLGAASSGEAEPMLIRHAGKTWLGLGSDHTDRELEATSVAASKQVCAKPCATTLWDLDLVVDRLDQLTIQSWIFEGDEWRLYQDGTLKQIRPLLDLAQASGLKDGCAMLCGTFAAIGGVRAAAKFRAKMCDPVRMAEITLEYHATPLPIIS
ncbi:DUF2848 domain-containing protein [Litoreibacter sp.]|nr:DUF2848 domain-containing protein [Litoreibacter sp.]